MKRIYSLALVLLCTTVSLFAQPASWQPELPRLGDVVTISYNPRLGTISPNTATLWLHWGVYDPATQSWSTPPQSIWPAGSRLHSDNVAVQSPMVRGTDSIWTVSIDFDTSVHHVSFVFTDGASSWDNNSNNNWIIDFVTPGTVSWWAPVEPVPGDTVTLFYDARPGTLPDNATNVILHWGVNETSHGAWQLPPASIWPAGTTPVGQAAQTPLISLGQGLFQLVIPTDLTIHSLHYVFTDGTNWDNHGNLNWDIFLVAPEAPVMTHRIFRYDPRSAFANSISGPINTVTMAGTFNNWSTTASPLGNIDEYGNHWAELVMPTGTTNYKFVINGGNWQTDPDNPRNNPNDNNNSMITLDADTMPQIFDIQPGQNQVFAAGTNVVVSVKIRGGDRGPGIMGTPTARLNGSFWNSTWNASTGQLTLAALPSFGLTADDVAISAADSAGRSTTGHLAYGFRAAQGYLAVDASKDNQYAGISAQDSSFDLLGMDIQEYANGDSIAFMIGLGRVDPNLSMVALTISSTLDGWGPVPGFGSEVNVPNLSSGGVSLLLLNPASTYYSASIHNRLHPFGDLTQNGPAVDFDMASQSLILGISKADLETYLGSYQTAWYFTCTSYKAAGAADGYCAEATQANGGINGVEEPDAYDMLFSYAADVETKLFHNYGLTRRTTLDAAGRGVAAITPQEIGPHIASPGPVCRILTQGAPTTNSAQTVVARITSAVSVSQVWLMQNNVRHNATMAADSFIVPVTLVEGENRFVAYAVDANGDTGRAPAMTFTLNVNHTPIIHMTTRVQSGQCILDASTTTDPESQTVTFSWTADPANPSAVTLQNAQAAIAQFAVPAVRGEYYFNVTASDPDGHSTTARTLFTVGADSAHGFANNECAYWVNNAIIYEIFVRTHSATSDFTGVTNDMQRIADLGVNCIWLMPIFEGPSDHGYEITDYYHLEQDYGTEQEFRELVSAAHARGIKVILDMVVNHTSINHPFMQDCIRHGRYSHYWDWYDRDANGNPTHYYDWTSLPNLNLNNAECAAYFTEMCKYWIQNFNVDGYRCDVAWGPLQRSPQFWVQWRAELKKIKPECLLLAEADASNFQIYSDRFDLAFDWNLHHQGASSFANMFPAVPGFTNLGELVTNYGVGWPAYKNSLRFMENHDEARFISVNTAPQTKLASSFMMTIPGDVMLYAGQEIGTTSQRGLPAWGTDPNGMYPHYYRLANARKLLPALRTGRFSVLSNSQNTTCYSYSRYIAGEVPVVWVGNFSANSQVVSVSVNLAALGLSPDSTYVVSDLLGGTSFTSSGSQLTSIVNVLPAYASRVYAISDHAISVDVPPSRAALPKSTTLGDAYPNPFNPSTILPLELNASSFVTLKIYDLLGREVATIVNGQLGAGFHSVTWDGTSAGRDVSSGLYFAVMRAGSVHQVRKLMLIR
jgi:glycosidase